MSTHGAHGTSRRTARNLELGYQPRYRDNFFTVCLFAGERVGSYKATEARFLESITAGNKYTVKHKQRDLDCKEGVIYGIPSVCGFTSLNKPEDALIHD